MSGEQVINFLVSNAGQKENASTEVGPSNTGAFF